ncbi:ABC transporter permease [Aquibacillus saliphilus]|uniref:ABC transporter permease n=1 Tax=Aquibacillus saliphilus TaxID=1909422 RepID=UPI001CF06E1C|nr:FtsX-like permease family protein [Aquibacillus saliphilus]
MAMLLLILRKMLNNRWLVGSLFLGLIITVSLVSSIPTYTSSILQKLLVKELEQHQIDNKQYPGEFSHSLSFSNTESQDLIIDAFDKIEAYDQTLTHDTGIPILEDVTILRTDPVRIAYEDEEMYDLPSSDDYGRITSLTNLEEHITILDGKFPSNEPTDGVYEVLVTQAALVDREMVLGSVLNASRDDKQFLIKPVGTFDAKNVRDPYWMGSLGRYNDDFIIPESLFKKDFLYGEDRWLANARFYTAYDYHQITVANSRSIMGLEDKVRAFTNEFTGDAVLFINFPIEKILSSYASKSTQLTTMLWSLNVPIIIMLAIYLFMVSRLIVDRQLNEIAVLRSRGAKRGQILVIYLVETVLLGGIALLIGPYLGLLLVKFLGAANGFLDFVQRSSLKVTILSDSYLYALWAVLACIVMVMIPVIQATSQSIVNRKQQSARVQGQAVWHKFFLDILLLGISWYGWWQYQTRQEELLTVSGGMLSVDPFLFFVPALFIIGLGLFCLRIYPWLIKIIYLLGKNYWSLSLYSTLLQVSRSFRQYQFLMLFLVMTIAVGVFSASAARTINNNLEEQLFYENGSDVALKMKWESQESSYASVAPNQEEQEGQEETDAISSETETAISYSEPPFEPITNLSGVERATRVFRKDNVTAEAKGQSVYSANLMGIEPKEFGETAWFKPQLLPHHWYEYLNLLASEPSSVLVSESIAARLGVSEGDYLTLNWDQSEQAEFVVYGVVDYWPAFNPNKQDDDEEEPTLIVANLPYVQNMMGLEPYDVWLKMEPNVSREVLYQDIRDRNIAVTEMNDIRPKLAELKNSAFLLGLNGTLTLGFLISIVITFIGFLLYWILTLKSRILQYGIYRAIGIKLSELIGILTWEQLLTSGLACLMGVAIGGLTSQLFVPLFQLSFDPKEQVPPFHVIFDAGDEMKIYLFILFMLTIGLGVLMYLLKRIRVHQAIKLGDD